MKLLKFALVTIAAILALTGFTETVLARSSISVGFGAGHGGFHHGHHWSGHHHNYSSFFIGGSWFWPDYYYPSYYIVEPAPVVLERAPVVIQRPVTYVQTHGVNANTFEDMRLKKAHLLVMFYSGNKTQRIIAIKELAGFSFDDNVRKAIEKVLLSDRDAELRKIAGHALGEVKNVKAKFALEKARVFDTDADVRKTAEDSIRKIEGSAS
jgi:hypothetical protein